MYIAVKGGEQAIAASLKLLAQARRGDPAVPELQAPQVREQLRLELARETQRTLAVLALEQQPHQALARIAASVVPGVMTCASFTNMPMSGSAPSTSVSSLHSHDAWSPLIDSPW